MGKKLCYTGVALHPAARKNLEAVYEVTEDMGRISECSAAVSYWVPLEWTEPGAAENLTAIGCHSCDPVQREWTGKKGIKVTLADSLWRTVAEHTLALMMAAARNLIPADREVREGRWNEHVHIKERFSGFDFQGKTLGILGMGQIGTQLADMVRGFRMNVIYNDIQPLSAQEEQELAVSFRSFDELMAESDYLCVLVPLMESTVGLLGRDAFSLMKKGVILVNTARAGIIDEAAFLEALEDGTIGAAALDVFWDEGTVQKKELTERDNVVMAPHLGGSTYECDMVLVNAVINGQPEFQAERGIL